MAYSFLEARFKTVFIICIAIVSGYSHANTNADMQAWLEKLPSPWTLSENSLNKVLPKFHKQFPDYDNRLRALSKWRVGTPYKIFNLGEEQAPDMDPIFRMDVSDCTSHILTTMALAESVNWTDARDTLIQIHYKPDINGVKKAQYSKRWHYTSDRLLNHPMTPDVTAGYIDTSQLKTASVHLNQKQDGSEFLALDWSLPVNIRYIPNDKITDDLLANLPSMIGVAFVKEAYFDMGIVMAHEGMILDGKSLLHAGQVAKETVIEDFMGYYFKTKDFKLKDSQQQDSQVKEARFDGIMLYKLKPLEAL